MSRNVFLDLGFSETEAAGLALKSCLQIQLQEIIRQRGITPKKVALILKLDASTVSDLVSGSMSDLSIDRIGQCVLKLGHDIHTATEPCPPPYRVGAFLIGASNMATKRKRNKAADDGPTTSRRRRVRS